MDSHSERIDPRTVPKGILAIHEARYRFAMRQARGMRVLDVACGAGYGAPMLAAQAQNVVGLDRDRDAVRQAVADHTGRDCRFLRASAGEMPFVAGAFGLVVSFETIEHLADPPGFLAEVCRVLAADGRAVISTPIVRQTTHSPENTHHTVEFSARDFRALLGRYFGEVVLWGQRRVQGRAHRLLQKLDFLGVRHHVPRGMRYRVDRSLGTEPFEEMSAESQEIVKEDLHRATVMLGVCRKPAEWRSP